MMAFDGVAGGVIEYRKVMGEADGRPFVVEGGLRRARRREEPRRDPLGINWTPSLSAIHWRLHPITEPVGMIDGRDPVSVLVHVVTPFAAYVDRGKTRAELPPEILEAISEALRLTTLSWVKTKNRKARDDRVTQRELDERESRPGGSASKRRPGRSWRRPTLRSSAIGWRTCRCPADHVRGPPPHAAPDGRSLLEALIDVHPAFYCPTTSKRTPKRRPRGRRLRQARPK